MRIKYIGKIHPEIQRIIKNRSIDLVEDNEDADFVVFSAKIDGYFLNSTYGEILESAYELEYQCGKPEVVTETDLLKKLISYENNVLRI